MAFSFMKATKQNAYSEVSTYNDLPDPTVSAGLTLLVLQPQGTWALGTLKRAGLYYSDGSTWSRLGNAQNFFYDDKFAIKNVTDPTKQLQVDASNITTATARTWNIKDADGTPFIENVSGLHEVAVTEKIGNPVHLDTLQELLDHVWSAGVSDGCELTVNPDGTVNIASGYASIRGSDDPDAHSTLYIVEVPAQNNLALTDNSVNYIYLDYNSGSPQFAATTSTSAFNCLDKCISHVAVRIGNNVNHIDITQQNVDVATKARRLFLDFSRFIHSENGSSISCPTGTTVAVTAGSFYFMLIKTEHPAFDTSVAGTANENVFKLHYRDGAGGWTEVADSKTIDTTVYDNNQVAGPTTLDNNKYGVTWFYICNNTPSFLCAIMGQEQYANHAEAVTATPPASLPPMVAGLGTLVGFVVYEKGNTTFDDVLSAFTQNFTSSAAVSHNNLAGLDGGEIGYYGHLSSTQHSNLTTNAWNLGTYNTDGTTLTLDLANYVTVTINGTPVKLAVLT